ILLSIAGILLLSHPFTKATFVIGDVLTVGCAIAFGVYIIFIDRAVGNARKLIARGGWRLRQPFKVVDEVGEDTALHAKMLMSATDPGAMLSAMQLIVAGIVIAVSMPFLETPKFIVGSTSVMALLYTAIFGTSITIFVQTKYQENVSPSVASIIYM